MSEQTRVLIVEDEIAHGEALAEALEREGYVVLTAASGEEGVEKLQAFMPHVVVTDLKLGGAIDGLGVLSEVVGSNLSSEVVLITAHSTIDTCKQALRIGAYDYIEKPIDLDHLREVVARASKHVHVSQENKRLREELDTKFGFDGVVGESPAMLKVLNICRRAAKSNLSVLLRGESGVGKELLAAAIHNNSPRKSGPFQAVNCAGLTDSLIESELFGHVKGSFTGALTDRKGFFAMADKGTLFMDEIGDMPLTMQAKLLRVLEDQVVVPVGSSQGEKVDVRIISATNQDLVQKVEEKEFRQDLYFRIRGVEVEIPPLRQRREDIVLLLDHFIKEFASSEGRQVKGFTPAALKILKSYDWPGNVRELRNCLKAMVVMADSELLDVADLPFEMHSGVDDGDELSNLAGAKLEELERTAIMRTLEMVGGNRETAAKMLGIGERTLYRKIKEYGLNG
ncbi:MAG: sigma-54-dependent Fis family transcriptional regulator [Sedimentisphaerales bacterium]|nr:sigma-54-dependent Fis family transcriptional regulator [Sedimentisphaerales bacterium]